MRRGGADLAPRAAAGEPGPSAGGAGEGGAWRVLRVRGDGRCLFRSVAQGEALRADPPRRLRAPEEEARADALRAACVAELESRRAEVEGFIAGSFERYLLKMSRSFTWGGEPELFALSHVLERQIWVRLSGGAGGEPGGGGGGGPPVFSKYGEGQRGYAEGEINLLYSGGVHYDLLVSPEQGGLEL